LGEDPVDLAVAVEDVPVRIAEQPLVWILMGGAAQRVALAGRSVVGCGVLDDRLVLGEHQIPAEKVAASHVEVALRRPDIPLAFAGRDDLDPVVLRHDSDAVHQLVCGLRILLVDGVTPFELLAPPGAVPFRPEAGSQRFSGSGAAQKQAGGSCAVEDGARRMRRENLRHRHDRPDSGVDSAGLHLAMVVGIDRNHVDRIPDILELGCVDETGRNDRLGRAVEELRIAKAARQAERHRVLLLRFELSDELFVGALVRRDPDHRDCPHHRDRAVEEPEPLLERGGELEGQRVVDLEEVDLDGLVELSNVSAVFTGDTGAEEPGP
jgi:hypothetical protein